MIPFDTRTEKLAEEHWVKVRNSICDRDFVAGRNSCRESMIEMARALEWYSDGIYPGDESFITPTELRSGRRAREAIAACKARGDWCLEETT